MNHFRKDTKAKTGKQKTGKLSMSLRNGLKQGLDEEMVEHLHQLTTSFPGTYQCPGIFLGSFRSDVGDCFSSEQYQPTPFTSWHSDDVDAGS